MDNTQEYTCLSLCSGYGGLELGLRRAQPNVRTVAYVEVEAFACANLVAKMEAGLLDAAPIWTDIKTFHARPFRNRIHIITAGYPCQGESCAGKRLGDRDPRWLWPHIERIIQTVQPVWFFGENVPGHLTLGYPTVYCGLRNLGYRVEAGLFTAAEVGAPHKRQRLFVLAHARSQESGGLSDCQWQESSTIRPASEMADPECPEPREGNRQEPQTGCGGDRFAKCSTGMADTPGNRTQGPEPEGTAQAGRQIDQQSDGWPARPGQQQYEWEEPRVVAHYRSGGHINGRGTAPVQDSNEQENGISQQDSQHKAGQTKSRLGRAVDGTSYPLDIAKGIKGGYRTKPGGRIGHYLVMEAKQRADRLRLCGNGVSPQQAEKAFRYLMSGMTG